MAYAIYTNVNAVATSARIAQQERGQLLLLMCHELMVYEQQLVASLYTPSSCSSVDNVRSCGPAFAWRLERVFDRAPLRTCKFDRNTRKKMTRFWRIFAFFVAFAQILFSSIGVITAILHTCKNNGCGSRLWSFRLSRVLVVVGVRARKKNIAEAMNFLGSLVVISVFLYEFYGIWFIQSIIFVHFAVVSIIFGSNSDRNWKKSTHTNNKPEKFLSSSVIRFVCARLIWRIIIGSSSCYLHKPNVY